MGYPGPFQKVDVIHHADPDEWCVTVDGARVLTFSGPAAWSNAISHKAELQELLTDHVATGSPAADSELSQ